jgi:hypothetical protein
MSKILSDDQKAIVRRDGSNLELIKLPNPLPNTRWVGGYHLGSGTYGLATLWVLVDNSTLRAVAHAVIKDAFEGVWEPTVEKGIYKDIYLQLKDKGLDFGVDPTHKIGHAAPKLRFLKEAYLQGLMTVPDAAEEIYCAQLYGYARKLLPKPHAEHRNHWRLYLPLYDYGDLSGLMSAHLYKSIAIPEPFLWHTLMCLMKAAVQLEEKARLRPHGTDSDVIVVCDMKPANILLAQPDRTSTFPIYPRPHVADLGGGCLTNRTDPKNISNTLSWTHTQGYLAPEMSKHLSEETLRGTWTNVWQIGRVLELMMKLIPEEWNDIDYRFRPGLTPADLEPVIMDYNYELPAQRNYSMTLRRVVADCLRLNPEYRPSPQALLEYMDTNKHLFRGMDTFGNDAWFLARQRNRAAAPPPPTNEYQEAALRAAEAEKTRRFVNAKPYLHAWGHERAAQYAELGVFPPEHYEVLYTDEANLWATETADFIWPDGTPVWRLPPPAAHPPAARSSSSAHIR